MYPYDEETGALNMSAGPGMLSQINNMVAQGNQQARQDALSSGLIGAGAGLLGYDKSKGPAAGLGAGLAGFNQAYDTQLVANKPKVTPLAGGAFVLVQYPDGRQEIVKNDEVAKYMGDAKAKELEVWTAKEQKKAEIQGNLANQKLADKTALENAGEIGSSLGQANQLRAIASELQGTAQDKVPATGPIAGLTASMLPNAVGSMIMPQSTKLRQDAERIIQNSLRATLGAQFTEKEGIRFLERAYNPSLPVADNVKRLTDIADELEMVATNKEAAVEYMKKNGTLEGFKPRVTPSGGGIDQATVEGYGVKYDPSMVYRIGPNGELQSRKK